MKLSRTTVFTIKMFYYWCGRLGIATIIPFKIDNSFNGHIQTEFIKWETGEIETILAINDKKIQKDWKEAELISGIFHEIGHLLYTGTYEGKDTDKAQDEWEEFMAETFAISILRYYFPDTYKNVCAYYRKKLKNKSWIKKHKLHYEAFKKIKDYQ